MKSVLAIALVLLTGCASTQGPVLVPITEPCTVQQPVEPATHFSPPYTNPFNAVRDLLSDRKLSEAYQIELKAALRACKGK